MTCRKANSGAFLPFVVYDRDQVEIRGELATWQSSPEYARQFCPQCGSRICGVTGDEIELSMGSFDEVGRFAPQYESWVTRREPWLAPLDVPQNPKNRSD